MLIFSDLETHNIVDSLAKLNGDSTVVKGPEEVLPLFT